MIIKPVISVVVRPLVRGYTPTKGGGYANALRSPVSGLIMSSPVTGQPMTRPLQGA
jgi:hypothetical protein